MYSFDKFIFNVEVKINYSKWIVFKNLQWFLTQLVSLIAIMESQFYKTFIGESKWISKWETWSL